MDNAKLHGILTRMTTVLGHLTGLPAGLTVAPQVAQIRADVAELGAAAEDGYRDHVEPLEHRVATAEKGLADLAISVAELHAALSTKAPAAVQKAVADVELPRSGVKLNESERAALEQSQPNADVKAPVPHDAS